MDTSKPEPAPDREEWHQKRREGIGGSDVAALLGISRWKNPQDLYKLKIGELEPDEPGPAAERGTRMEPQIVRRFQEITGLTLSPGHEFLRHPRWPEIPIQANTDGTIEGKAPGVFEAKTAAQMTEKALAFQQGRIPTEYNLQIQAYLSVTGYRWGAIAAMIGPRHDFDWDPDACEMVILSFRPNPEAIEMIEEVCADFWRCVDARTPPTWRRHPRSNELIMAVEQTRVRAYAP
jgi:putative phage-type endonuclease